MSIYNFSVTKNGKELSSHLYSWNINTKIFSTNEDNLVLDFRGINNCTFITGSGCTFITGNNCTFTTGSGCTFDTHSKCTFTTHSGCTFTTESKCTFTTGSGCIFTTYSGCTFTTETACTFNTGSNCTFTTGTDCIIIRRDIFEVIQPVAYIKIKLNKTGSKGYKEVKEIKPNINNNNTTTICIRNINIQISNEDLLELKETLTNY